MKRREFIKNSTGAGLAVASTLALGNLNYLFAGNGSLMVNSYGLVAIKGGAPDVMFDRAIAALGGMKNYVKQGQKVVINPNIGWNVIPERGGNTNPKLVRRIIEHCLKAGAKQVYVFDNTCDTWNECYKTSGIQRAVKDAGGKMVPGNTESYYHQVNIPKGKKLKTAKVHELILESDVYLNVPILKSHGSTRLTIAMKNMMGIVWDRRYWHDNDLHQCIADFCTYKKPDLNIVDAYYVMKQHGPRGVSIADVVKMKSQLLAKDIVAVDAAATKLLSLQPENISYINKAHTMKIGNKNLEKLSIKKIKL